MASSCTPTMDVMTPGSPDYLSQKPKESYELEIHAAKDALKNMSLTRGPSENERAAKTVEGVDEMASALESEDGQKVVKAAVSSAERLARRFEDLSEGLDDAARIHPVIAVAVFAFKVALKLELTRRENDHRILALYDQMCDIMDILLHVRLLPNPEGEGGPVDDLLKTHIERLAVDIHQCAAMCDSFKKASFLDRLLRSSDWKSDLCRFIEVFDYHFRFLDRTILILCTITVKDAAQVTLETNNRVIEIKSHFEQAGAGPYRKAGGQGDPDSLALNMPEEMWEEVGSDHQSSVADIVRSNAEIFDKKFALQKDALRRPSNHTMLSEITKLWDDMGWDKQHRADDVVGELVKKFCGLDSVPTTNPLLEAIDADASSSITIAELAVFTRIAPEGWTPRLWFRYWLTGAPVAFKRDYDRIEQLLGKIQASSLNIRPGNRAHVQRLLGEGVFLATDYLLSGVYDSVQSIVPNTKLYEPEYREYDDAEERRIKRTLEDLKYNLDAPNTLSLVIQPGNIEKGIFIILYLLLSECLDLIAKACSQPITKKSVLQLRQSFWTLLQFIYDRVDAICDMNVDSQISHRERLTSFAFGMYRYTYYRKEIGTSNYMKRSRDEGSTPGTPGTRYRQLEGRSVPRQRIPEVLGNKISSVTQDPSDGMYTFVSLCAAQGVSDISLAGGLPAERFMDMFMQAARRATHRATSDKRDKIPLPKLRDDQPLSAISRQNSLVPSSNEWQIQDPEVFVRSLLFGRSPSEVEEYCWFVDLIVWRQVIHSPVRCDACCAPTLIMTRIICLGCFIEDPSRTVDYCAKCIRQGDSIRCHRSGPHNPHSLLQLRQFTYNKWGNRYTDRALEFLQGRGLRVRIEGSLASETPHRCLACGCNLKRPFWGCLDCPETAYMCCQCNDAVENKLNYLILEDILPVHQYAGSASTISPSASPQAAHHWSHSMVLMVPFPIPLPRDSSEIPSPGHSVLFGPHQRPQVQIHAPDNVPAPCHNPWKSEGERPSTALLTPNTPGRSLSSSPMTISGPPTPLVAYGPASSGRRQFPRVQDTRYQSNPTPAELSSISQKMNAKQFSPVRPSPLRRTISRRKSLPTSLPSEEDNSIILGPRTLPLEPPNLGAGSSPITPAQPVAEPVPTLREARAPELPTQTRVGVAGHSVLEARMASLEMAFGNNLSSQIASHASHLEKAQELIGSHLLRLERLATSLDTAGHTLSASTHGEAPRQVVTRSNGVSTSSSAHGEVDDAVHERLASLETKLEQFERVHRRCSASSGTAPGTSSGETILNDSAQAESSPASPEAALPAGSHLSATAPRGRFLKTAQRLMSFHRRSASTGVVYSRAEAP